MNINPKQVIKEGIILADVDDFQIQMVGIDMRVRKIKMIGQNYFYSCRPVELSQGCAYEFVIDRIKMPKDKWGYIIGRSSFNRRGVLIRSSVIDPGYEGDMGVTAYCFTSGIMVTHGDRVAQLLVFPADAISGYGGQFQEEKKL